MAGTDSRRELLSLIRDFATEKSHCERKVSDLRNRSRQLQPALDAANSDIEKAKLSKETIEQELRGSEVELSMKDASIQALEARISLLQKERTKLGADLEDLKSFGFYWNLEPSTLDRAKNNEDVVRDDFISTMSAFNKKIRKFQEKLHSDVKDERDETSSIVGRKVKATHASQNIQDALKAIEDKLVQTSDQTHMVEQEYQEEENIHKEVLQILPYLEKRAFFMEAITKETKELEELAGQTADSEKEYASLGELLQRRYVCPNCQLDNMAGTPTEGE